MQVFKGISGIAYLAAAAAAALILMGFGCYTEITGNFYQGDAFGRSVAVEGDTMVVGVPEDDDRGTESGSAYVWVRSDGVWERQQKLNSPVLLDYDLFGSAVAISGDTIVVAAEGYDFSSTLLDTGAVFVFVRNGGVWTKQDILFAPGWSEGNLFGSSVAIDGDTLVVGERNEGGDIPNGRAHVFVRNGTEWSYQAQIDPPFNLTRKFFGNSVDVEGDTIVIGQPASDPSGDGGAAYVYTRSGSIWTRQQTIQSPQVGQYSDRFGVSVSISGGTILIGAENQNSSTFYSGAAYAFTQSGGTWTLQDTLLPSGAVLAHGLGSSVSIDGDRALVTAKFQTEIDGVDVGGVGYAFARSGGSWTEVGRFYRIGPDTTRSFGYSASLDNDTGAFGVPGDDENGTDSGMVQVVFDSVSGWEVQQDIFAMDEEEGSNAGYAVAVDGEIIALGVPGASGGIGAVHMVRRVDGELEHVRQLRPVSSYFQRFGSAVAADGERIIVGAPATTTDFGGAVYIFASSTAWNVEGEIYEHLFVTESGLGASVDISGDLAVAGAPGDDHIGTDAGVVYLLHYTSGWSEGEAFYGLPGHAGEELGKSVSISGDTVVAGAPGASGDSGAAFVYTVVGFGEIGSTEALTSPNPAAGSRFGSAVSIDGDLLAVGAPGEDAGNGKVYVYNKTESGWVLQAEISAPPAISGGAFGASLSLKGHYLTVGAPNAIVDEVESGAAYLYLNYESEWAPLQPLTPTVSADEDLFGWSVATTGGTTIVGAPNVMGKVFNKVGRAYVYTPPQAELTVENATVDPPRPVGHMSTYRFQVANAGPEAAPGATVEVTLPEGAEYVSSSVSGGTCGQSSGTVSCSVDVLSSGQTLMLEVDVTLTQVGTFESTARAYGFAFDLDIANNAASATLEAEEPIVPGVPGVSWLGLIALASGMLGLFYVRTLRKPGAEAS